MHLIEQKNFWRAHVETTLRLKPSCASCACARSAGLQLPCLGVHHLTALVLLLYALQSRC